MSEGKLLLAIILCLILNIWDVTQRPDTIDWLTLVIWSVTVLTLYEFWKGKHDQDHHR